MIHFTFQFGNLTPNISNLAYQDTVETVSVLQFADTHILVRNFLLTTTFQLSFNAVFLSLGRIGILLLDKNFGIPMEVSSRISWQYSQDLIQ